MKTNLFSRDNEISNWRSQENGFYILQELKIFQSFKKGRKRLFFPTADFYMSSRPQLASIVLVVSDSVSPWNFRVFTQSPTCQPMHAVMHGGKKKQLHRNGIFSLGWTIKLKRTGPVHAAVRCPIDHRALMRNTVYLFSTWSCTRVFRAFRPVSVVVEVVCPYSHFSKHPSGPRICPCSSLIWLRVSVSVRKYPNFRGIYHWSPVFLLPGRHLLLVLTEW